MKAGIDIVCAARSLGFTLGKQYTVLEYEQGGPTWPAAVMLFDDSGRITWTAPEKFKECVSGDIRTGDRVICKNTYTMGLLRLTAGRAYRITADRPVGHILDDDLKDHHIEVLDDRGRAVWCYPSMFIKVEESCKGTE